MYELYNGFATNEIIFTVIISLVFSLIMSVGFSYQMEIKNNLIKIVLFLVMFIVFIFGVPLQKRADERKYNTPVKKVKIFKLSFDDDGEAHFIMNNQVYNDVDIKLVSDESDKYNYYVEGYRDRIYHKYIQFNPNNINIIDD